jgi:hypothetical protein
LFYTEFFLSWRAELVGPTNLQCSSPIRKGHCHRVCFRWRYPYRSPWYHCVLLVFPISDWTLGTHALRFLPYSDSLNGWIRKTQNLQS